MSVVLYMSILYMSSFCAIQTGIDYAYGYGDVNLMTSVNFYTYHSFQCDFCFALLNVQCEDKRTEL